MRRTTVQITLNPKSIEAKFNGPLTKVYDGTTAAPTDLKLKLYDVLTGDDVSVTCDSIAFDTAEVGNNRLITATGISLSGNDANYYALSDTTATTSGSITKSDSALTVEPSSASLTYGDTLTIKVTPERSAANSINALTEQDTVELLTSEGTVLATAAQPDNDGAYILTYDTTGKGLSIGQNTLTVNYRGSGNLNSSTAAVTVDLSAKPVTASVSGTPSKTFDGETDVDVVLTFASGTLAGSDNFTGMVSGNFFDANVAEDKPITLSSSPVWTDPDTAGFYTVTLPDSVTVTISKAELVAPQNLSLTSTAPGKATATWDEVQNAGGYTAQLYKDGEADGEPVIMTGTSCEFSIVEAGSYTFTVTAIAEENGNYADGKESSPSASLYFGTVTMDTDGNGTASASVAFAAEGTEITLTANADADSHFVAWEVVPDNIKITDNKFTMPAENVEIKAVFAEHSYVGWKSNGNDTHTGACSCGETKTEACSYIDGTCTVCGYVDLAITTNLENTTVKEGETATFTVAAKGEDISYQWQISTGGGSAWADIVGATGQSYTTQAATMDMSGYQYRCTVSNTTGDSATSNAVTLTVNKVPSEMEPAYIGYFVEHYQKDPASGAYTLYEQQYLVDEINKEVTAAPKTYQGYTYTPDAEGTVTSGKLTEIKNGADIVTLRLYYDLTTFTVTVETSGNGDASASPASATMGQTVALTATPAEGSHLVKWEVVPGNIVLNGNTFTMPASDVTVLSITFI